MSWLDPLVGWLGLTAVIVIGCVALGYFFPPLRRIAIEVAGVALASATIYTQGNRDEKKKWDQAEQNTINKSNKARSDAERDVAADPDGVRNDQFNRDNK
jgi:hypothetical protein